jgi:O-methyltransferase
MREHVARLGKKLFRTLGYQITKRPSDDDYSNWSTAFSVVDMEDEVLAIYKKIRPYTLVGIERSYGLFQAVRYVVENHIKGDFVEVGVWRGGSSALILETLNLLGVTDRNIYLYDAFEGTPPPSEIDVQEKSGRSASDLMASSTRGAGAHNVWAYATLQDVEANLKTTGYPSERIRFVKGRIEDTVPATLPGGRLPLAFRY